MKNHKPTPPRRAWSIYDHCQVPAACAGVPPPHQVLELQPSRERKSRARFFWKENSTSQSRCLKWILPPCFVVFFFPQQKSWKKRGLSQTRAGKAGMSLVELLNVTSKLRTTFPGNTIPASSSFRVLAKAMIPSLFQMFCMLRLGCGGEESFCPAKQQLQWEP